MNTAIPTSSVRSLLECYLRAKDLNRPELISECFSPDAELTFSIATRDIDFPRRVNGAPAIATTLVADFGERFDRCRTYYVCTKPQVDEGRACSMPWLVVMRQKETGSLRIGKGMYRWRFGSETGGKDLVVQLHIHIERMDAVPDPHAEKLSALQGALLYPWLPPIELQDRLAHFITMHSDAAFALPFGQPAAFD
ncbi:nuclear transport factor 2 family protein [Paraburkholderia sp. BL17N1]|uniref:nuclear transport factor 2 family protein n=1 Tax=Paraburkholderia sp. BL17N1 TaxID=1938798 RepID=UPI000EAEF2CE|nr:nuclear transport factor 2 family protein [Paraburkholderia sp. BL17N1]RKR36901.1 SnoaL-like protein [Paraburkholderia sp. BL17N1]